MTSQLNKNKFLVFIAVILFAITWLINNESSKRRYNFENRVVIINSKRETHRFNVVAAANAEQRAKGLMDVKRLDKDSGMLFLFENPRQVSFWMKDTYIPLDILFVDEKGVVVKIHENAKPLSLEYIASDKPVSKVLEINGGQAKERNLAEGDEVFFQPKQAKPSSRPSD